jgi:2-hydroxy-3-keto-5-methylthiopentenyl-1-phosphate phosphatase
MLISAVLVDFDGTACPHDVSAELLEVFAQPGWRDLDEAVDRGELGLRQAAERQAAMLHGTRDEMLTYALERFSLDPTFPGFVRWADGVGVPLAVVSDGFGFHVGPMLGKAGLGHLEVLTNELEVSSSPKLHHPHAHPVCVGCGTCKMLAATGFRDRHGPVAFIGEGQSDRYGALYSDVVFAKKELVRICREDGVRFFAWDTFDDVRRTLEELEELPGPVSPEVCPGWRLR